MILHHSLCTGISQRENSIHIPTMASMDKYQTRLARLKSLTKAEPEYMDSNSGAVAAIPADRGLMNSPKPKNPMVKPEIQEAWPGISHVWVKRMITNNPQSKYVLLPLSLGIWLAALLLISPYTSSSFAGGFSAGCWWKLSHLSGSAWLFKAAATWNLTIYLQYTWLIVDGATRCNSRRVY